MVPTSLLARLAVVTIAAAPGPGAGDRSTTVNTTKELEKALDHRASRAERTRAIRALGGSGSEVVIVPLVLELQRVDEGLAEELRRALQELGATRFLARELASTDAEVRTRAAELIALVPGPEGLEPLLIATRDPVAKVRELSAAALWRFARPGATPAADEAVGILVALLGADPDPDTRSAAAQSLGRIGGSEARRALVAAESSERDAFVRVLIQGALERIDAEGR